MQLVLILVRFAPPWKQAPANGQERERQDVRRQELVEAANRTIQSHIGFPWTASVRIEIRYTRHGRSGPDPANIIGGIADALQGIAYQNDRQLTQIRYDESGGSFDEYEVQLHLLNEANCV